jgi:hypothetical protein
MPSIQTTLGYNAPLKARKKEEDDRGDFSRGFAAGVDQTQALGGGLKAWLGSVVGDEEMVESGLDYYQEQMAEAASNAGEVMRIEEIEGMGSLADYIQYQAGAFLPSLATSLAGGGIGGFVAKKAAEKKIKSTVAERAKDFAQKRVKQDVQKAKRKELERRYIRRAGDAAVKSARRKGQAIGAIGTGSAMFTGETTGAIYDETGEISPGVALGAGILGGSLDALVGLRALRKILPEGRYRQAADDIGEEISSDPTRFDQVFSALKKSEIGKSAPIEGVTEAMQEYVQEVAIKYVDGNYSDLAGAMAEAVTQEGALSLYTNAAAAGVVGGAVAGGASDVGGAITNRMRPARPEPRKITIKDEPDPEPTPDQEPDPDAPQPEAAPAPEPEPAVSAEEQIRRNLEARERIRELFEQQQNGELDLGEPVLGDTKMEELEGTQVEYEGVRGFLKKTDQGYFVVTQDEDILVEAGETGRTANSLGVRPAEGEVEVEFDNDATYDGETSTITMRGKKYTYKTANTNEEGEVVSLTATDESGKDITIRQPELVERIQRLKAESEQQVKPEDIINQPMLAMDDLPVPIQRQFMLDAIEAGETSMPEQVTRDDALSKVNKIPDADPNQLTLDIENTAEKAITRFTNSGMEVTGEFEFTRYANGPWEQVDRTNTGFGDARVPVADAIQRHNNLAGKQIEKLGTTDIYIPEALDPENPFPQMDGGYEHITKEVISQLPATASQEDQDNLNLALIDVLSAGLPARVLNYVDSFGVYERSKQKREGILGFYVPSVRHLAIDLQDLRENPGVGRNTVVHELGHALDFNENITSTDPNWDVEFSQKEKYQPLLLEMSDIMGEAYDVYVEGGMLGTYFSYPFAYAYDRYKKAADKSLTVRQQAIDNAMDFLKKEVFAQSFALYVGNPKLLAEKMPKMYDYMNELAKKEASDVQTSNEGDGAAQTQPSPDGILPKIRPSAPSRTDAVDDNTGAGQGGGASAVQEQASEVMGGTEREDGDSGGSADLEPQILITPVRRRRQQEPEPAEPEVQATEEQAPAEPTPEPEDTPAPQEPEPRSEEEEQLLNEAVREENKSKFARVKTFLRRQLAPGGLLPESAFKLKIERDSELGAIEIDIGSLVGEFDKAVKETYGSNPPDDVVENLNSALQNIDEIDKMGINGRVKDSIVAMRAYLDKMSVEYAQIVYDDAVKALGEGKTESAVAKVDLLKTIVGNLGKYVHRSYRAFDDENWAKNVPDDVLNAARKYLENRGSDNPELVINELLKDGTAYDSMESMIKESMLGAKDLSILKQRKDIAPEIRALLGEYTDARVNFGKSATKMSRLLFNDRFLRKIKEDGMGVYLFDRADAPAEAFTTFAPDGSSAMAPLSGLKTTPEIHQAFRDALDKEQMSDWYRTVVQLNGMVKFGKTILAPTTMSRNYISASLFAVMNGHFNMAKAREAWSSKSAIFSNEGEKLAYVRRLKQLGGVDDAPYAGELMKLLEESRFEVMQESDLVKKIPGGEAATGKAKAFLDFMTKLYQYGDDFWKIIGFENEIDILMENKGLSREQAEPLAAERIRNTYPTYSMVGKAGTWLRRFPLAGTFVSFPAEIIRTQFNVMRYLKQEMDDPAMKDVVPRRIAGLTMASAGAYALTAALRDMLDVDEDEDEAVRLLAPPWSANSNIAYVGRKDGNLRYIDLSALDPYSYFKKPINALLRDQPFDDAVIQAGQELMTPFLGEDIAFGAITDIWQNEKDTGAQVYNPSDTPANQLADITGHLFQKLQPGAVGNLNRMIDALQGDISKSGRRYEVDDELAAIFGFRASTIDPKVSLYYRAYEFNEAKRRSTDLLRSTFRAVNEVSDAELRSAFQNSSQARREAFEQMIKIVEATRRSGLTDSQIQKVLRSNGITLKDTKALLSGDVTKYNITDSTLKSSIKRADFLVGESTAAEFQRRFRYLQSLEEE